MIRDAGGKAALAGLLKSGEMYHQSTALMAIASLVDEGDQDLLELTSTKILGKLINEFKRYVARDQTWGTCSRKPSDCCPFLGPGPRSRWRTNNSAILKFGDYARTLRDLAAIDENATKICEMGGLDLVVRKGGAKRKEGEEREERAALSWARMDMVLPRLFVPGEGFCQPSQPARPCRCPDVHSCDSHLAKPTTTITTTTTNPISVIHQVELLGVEDATDHDLQMAAAALWQLTYNQTCRQQVRNSANTIARVFFLRELKRKRGRGDPVANNISKSCNGVIWELFPEECAKNRIQDRKMSLSEATGDMSSFELAFEGADPQKSGALDTPGFSAFGAWQQPSLASQKISSHHKNKHVTD